MSVVPFPGKHHIDRRAIAVIEEATLRSDDELMPTPNCAIWLGVSDQWLEIGRTKGWGPPFVKLSPRRVRYRVGDVKRWLAERSHRCTVEYQKRLHGGDQPAPERLKRIPLDAEDLLWLDQTTKKPAPPWAETLNPSDHPEPPEA